MLVSILLRIAIKLFHGIVNLCLYRSDSFHMVLPLHSPCTFVWCFKFNVYSFGIHVYFSIWKVCVFVCFLSFTEAYFFILIEKSSQHRLVSVTFLYWMFFLLMERDDTCKISQHRQNFLLYLFYVHAYTRAICTWTGSYLFSFSRLLEYVIIFLIVFFKLNFFKINLFRVKLVFCVTKKISPLGPFLYNFEC